MSDLILQSANKVWAKHQCGRVQEENYIVLGNRAVTKGKFILAKRYYDIAIDLQAAEWGNK